MPMSEPVDSEIDDSRTQSFRGKRSLAVAEGEDFSASTLGKRSRRSPHGPPHHRDFVPMGASFSSPGQLINTTSPDADNSSDSPDSSAHDPESHRARSTDREGSTEGPVTARPRSPGGPPILGQNRLIIGFAKPHTQPSTAIQDDTYKVSQTDSASRNSVGESADDAIEISDDTDLEDQSEDGGMVINVDDDSPGAAYSASEDGPSSRANLAMREPTTQNFPLEESLLSDGEVQPMEEEERSLTARAKRRKCSNCGEKGHAKGGCPLSRNNLNTTPSTSTQMHGDDTHNQRQDDSESSLSSNSTAAANTGLGPAPQRLGDLPTPQFEMQVRYILFHLKRNQIDLNRPAVCITCLRPGHQESNCPESNCVHCGVKDEHPSRMCPKYRRCLKCRERGHDVDACVSKLKNTTVPCDCCGREDHLEDSCLFRFFPIQSQASPAGLKLWVSCCICASKTHLVGDCPERRASTQAAAWSLRMLDPMQISNLSLESGTRKIERDVEIRGARQESLMIKGRADRFGNAAPRRGGQKSFEEQDTERIRSRRAATSRHDFREDFYRPSSESRSRNVRNDRYQPSYTDYRDQPPDRRDAFYATDSFGQRRRSRSPESRNTRAAKRDYSFQPPLPNEPLPSPPPPPSRQGSRASAPSKQTQDRGPPGVDSYRPMPSAAKQAWDKFRL